ncbi:MAG: hypothetical protein HYX24_02250 [Candidatus Aenigmarchaeota archaeon]|nr:hypothetical protein [Candidatus Aenigmarchaeota archaeon]
MGQLKVIISDEAERGFRKASMERFGYQKGSISHAAEIALKSWADSSGSMEEARKMAAGMGISNPIEAIKGMLRHVKKSAKDLRHEAHTIRADRWRHVSYRRKRLS